MGFILEMTFKKKKKWSLYFLFPFLKAELEHPLSSEPQDGRSLNDGVTHGRKAPSEHKSMQQAIGIYLIPANIDLGKISCLLQKLGQKEIVQDNEV